MPFDSSFHTIKRRILRDSGKMLKQQSMCILAFDYFKPIEDLTMRRALPYRKNHRFPKPALNSKFLESSQATVDFHGPFSNLHGKFCCPVFRQMSHETEQVVLFGIGGLFPPDQIQEFHCFPCQDGGGTQVFQTILKLAAQQRVPENGLAEGDPFFSIG